jgi:hypothetical protein
VFRSACLLCKWTAFQATVFSVTCLVWKPSPDIRENILALVFAARKALREMYMYTYVLTLPTLGSLHVTEE